VARGLLLTIVLLATSMIIGDGVLTPAISVISAIQGLTNASPNINNSASLLQHDPMQKSLHTAQVPAQACVLCNVISSRHSLL